MFIHVIASAARFAWVVALLLTTSSVIAQGESASATRALPTPGQFIGRPLGERFTPHAQLVAYAREATRLSERVKWVRYGKTPEGRPLLYLVVTGEANHARMDELKSRHAKIADPRLRVESDTDAGLLENQPAVVWLSYNVHGNEPSPSEAWMKVLHRLATADDDETTGWLDRLIIILDPCLNPDGRDRYAQWFNSMVGRRPDPELQSLEHREPWPAGRFNHWGFDLNRDWAFATQPETQARLPHFTEWDPQVHVDFHEMGHESNYFFFPAERPINANLPDSIVEWGKTFGRGNAEAFDARGWAYYTGEAFDLFYPGYGDSWPSFTGAIGMTYEQGGHGRAGAAVRRRSGSLLTLKQRLEHHEVASYATLKTAADNRAKLLGDYLEFRNSAIEEGRKGAIRAWLLSEGTDPSRTRALIKLLLRQGIEVSRLIEGVTLKSVTNALGQTELDRSFPKGTWVVKLDQPLKRLAQTLLEPRTKIKELYFYDVSAWSLPLAYGVKAFASPIALKCGESLQGPNELEDLLGGIDKGPSRVGWLLPYDHQSALRALSALLRQSVNVRCAHQAFSVGEESLAPGTMVIKRAENKHIANLDTVVATVGREHGISLIPVQSGYTERGIDLGSSDVKMIVKPRIALLGGEGVSTTSFGATRFLLDQVLDLEYSVLPLKRAASLNLEGFTTVVIPECSSIGTGSDQSETAKAFKEFVRGGGVVVGMGRSAFALTRKGGPTSVSTDGGRPESAEAPKGTKNGHRFIAEREAHQRKAQLPGAIFRIELDPSHPLSFGYRTEIAAFQSGIRTFDPKGPGTHVGLFKAARPLSGYVNQAASKAMEGRAYVSVQSMGRGAIVLFADDPNFRGAWRGLSRLFINASLLLPQRHIPWLRGR